MRTRRSAKFSNKLRTNERRQLLRLLRHSIRVLDASHRRNLRLRCHLQFSYQKLAENPPEMHDRLTGMLYQLVGKRLSRYTVHVMNGIQLSKKSKDSTGLIHNRIPDTRVHLAPCRKQYQDDWTSGK